MKLLILLILLAFSGSALSQAKQIVTAYSYHLKPPLIVDLATQRGLYFDLLDYLNQTNQQYHFELVFVPRKRIERMLDSGTFDGILLGVNPIWFKDKEEEKYLWTSRVFTDRDEIISLKNTPLEYSDSASIQDKVFGGVRGFYYFGINELIKDKKALRVDTVNEVELFTMLMHKRIDVAVVSRSTYDYLVRLNQWQDEFHLSRKPHDIFDRRILVPKSHTNIFEHIVPFIDNLQYDKSWQARLNSYK